MATEIGYIKCQTVRTGLCPRVHLTATHFVAGSEEHLNCSVEKRTIVLHNCAVRLHFAVFVLIEWILKN